MDAPQPIPGTHLRKNQKQILAMFRAAVAQAGLEVAVATTGSGRGTTSGKLDGAVVIELDYVFSTNGVDATIRVPGSGNEFAVPGLYTDTTLIMNALRSALELPQE